jgi:hypothetical protein
MSIHVCKLGVAVQVLFASPCLQQLLLEQLPSLLHQHQQLQQKLLRQAERDYHVVSLPSTSSDGSQTAAEEGSSTTRTTSSKSSSSSSSFEEVEQVEPADQSQEPLQGEVVEVVSDRPTSSSKSNMEEAGAGAAAAANPPAIGPHITASLGNRRSPGRTALLLLSVLLQTGTHASKQELLQMLAGEGVEGDEETMGCRAWYQHENQHGQGQFAREDRTVVSLAIAGRFKLL